MLATFDDGTDDGRDVTVSFDQRDVSALERNRARSFRDLPEIEATRWVVWHAGRRSLLEGWPQSFEQFETLCVAVNPVGVESVDPTQPVPEGG
jgi:hypothetical protein